MPASLPGDTLANNIGNPTLGRMVTFDLASGPKGSPFDRDDTVLSWDANNHPVYTQGAITKASTGGLATGIGFGSPPIFNDAALAFNVGGSVKGFSNGDFTDDYTVGVSKPDNSASADSTIMYIGGGKSGTIAVNAAGGQSGYVPAVPYTAGFGVGNAGNGGSRDAGAGPAFTGFRLKSVTATADTINGDPIEAGWVNRSGEVVKNTYSAFGSSTTASAAPTLEEVEFPPPPPPEPEPEPPPP